MTDTAVLALLFLAAVCAVVGAAELCVKLVNWLWPLPPSPPICPGSFDARVCRIRRRLGLKPLCEEEGPHETLE
jgi:hypothetical protein